MEKRDLSHIRRVDIELQSYCNRQCKWCPNNTFDRTFKEIMPDEMFSNILKQLDEQNFSKQSLQSRPIKDSLDTMPVDTAVLSFIGYQECFTDVELLKRRLAEAREVLDDRINFVISSNGDLITKESLEHLLFTNVAIQDYDNKGLDYWKNKFLEWEVLPINYSEQIDMLYGIHRYVESVTVQLNWSKNIELENRGGFFKHGDLLDCKWMGNMQLRTRPCPEPEYFINISYDGSVMPCCHMRPDNPAHKEFILGNVKDTPLVDIYYSEKAENLRKQLYIPNGDYPEPCKYCQKTRIENCIGAPSGRNYIHTTGTKEVIQ